MMCSPPIHVLGLHLTYRTPKRVVFDSMVYNVLVYGEGQYGTYKPMAMHSCDYSEETNTCIISGMPTHTPPFVAFVPFQVRREPFWRGFTISVQVILLPR